MYTYRKVRRNSEPSITFWKLYDLVSKARSSLLLSFTSRSHSIINRESITSTKRSTT